MSNLKIFSTEAWLLIGLTGSIPGVLKLSDGRLSYEAFGCGTLWKGELNKLERNTGKPGIADRMERDEDALLFDVALSEVKAVFPWYYFMGGMKIKTGGVEYRFSFGAPGNTRMPDRYNISKPIETVEDVNTMRGRGKVWKAILSRESAVDTQR